ncbi:hypothetical protein WME94_52965 [Sorangium sp. So ce429]
MRFRSAAGPTVRAFAKDLWFEGDEDFIRASTSPTAEQLVVLEEMFDVPRDELAPRLAATLPPPPQGAEAAAPQPPEPPKPLLRAGHENLKTTQGYIRDAEALEFLREEVCSPWPSALFLPEFCSRASLAVTNPVERLAKGGGGAGNRTRRRT